jgi:hypothetical protein
LACIGLRSLRRAEARAARRAFRRSNAECGGGPRNDRRGSAPGFSPGARTPTRRRESSRRCREGSDQQARSAKIERGPRRPNAGGDRPGRQRGGRTYVQLGRGWVRRGALPWLSLRARAGGGRDPTRVAGTAFAAPPRGKVVTDGHRGRDADARMRCAAGQPGRGFRCLAATSRGGPHHTAAAALQHRPGPVAGQGTGRGVARRRHEADQGDQSHPADSSRPSKPHVRQHPERGFLHLT